MLPRDKLSLVHLACNRLEMGEDDYRALLKRAASVTSSKDLDTTGFNAVMAEFERLGFESTANRERRLEIQRQGTHATYQQQKKIQAMWNTWKGQRDPAGLNRWLSAHFHVGNLRFLARDVAPKVIGALQNFKQKAAAGGITPPDRQEPGPKARG